MWEALVEELEGSGSLLVDIGSDQENSFVIFGTMALRVKKETPFSIFGLRKMLMLAKSTRLFANFDAKIQWMIKSEVSISAS